MQELECRKVKRTRTSLLIQGMIDTKMSYRGSSLRFYNHPTWNHVWDCLVITDIRPIFPSISAPLFHSYSLSGSFELTRYKEDDEYPVFQKDRCWGSCFSEAKSPYTHFFTHTHTHAERFRWCQDKWTQMLCPAVQAVLRLKKSCIMTSNFRTETECLCAESSVVTLFPLLSLSFLYLWQNLWCFAKFLFFFYVALGCSN